MAKTRFTEVRLRAITVRLESEMWCVLEQMSENIELFETGERTKKEVLSKHRTYVERFLRQEWYYLKAVRAANRIDGCEQDKERHYVTDGYLRAIRELQTLCEFFEK